MSMDKHSQGLFCCANIRVLTLPKAIKGFANNADSSKTARNELSLMKSAFLAT